MPAPLTRRYFLGALATTAVVAPLSARFVHPAAAATSAPPVFSRRGAAINGYDPVAYFIQQAPVKGDTDHSSTWNGATWRFASADNKAVFDANPDAYAPQYGGYCAYAVANGYTAKTDPDAWSIVDGKLYLNYSRRVRKRWLEDVPGNIAKGDANWPSVLG